MLHKVKKQTIARVLEAFILFVENGEAIILISLRREIRTDMRPFNVCEIRTVFMGDRSRQ